MQKRDIKDLKRKRALLEKVRNMKKKGGAAKTEPDAKEAKNEAAKQNKPIGKKKFKKKGKKGKRGRKDDYKTTEKKFKINEERMEELERSRVRRLEQEQEPEPQSDMDFEKMILRAPNNVEIWVKYIGFTYENKGIQEARKLSQRALNVINFGDDKTKMSLYKSMINLEFYFGDEKSTVEIFHKAVNACDHFPLCNHMTDLYCSKGDFEKAEFFVKINLKKSRKGKKSWSNYIKFLYKWKTSLKKEDDADSDRMEEEGEDSDDEEATGANKQTTEEIEQKEGEIEQKIESIVSRAKQSLPKKDFTFFQVQKAIEEFKAGDIGRGMTSFEQLVTKLPKRTDIWMVYLDMMVKYSNDVTRTRELFDRVVGIKFKPKCMKTFFVKYLEFEKGRGDSKRIELVKAAAARFIQEQISLRRRQEEGDEESEEEEAQEYEGVAI